MSSRNDALYDGGGQWRRWEMESFDPEPEAPPSSAETADAGASLPDPADVLAGVEVHMDLSEAQVNHVFHPPIATIGVCDVC